MSARILEGRTLAQQVRTHIKSEIAQKVQQGHRAPGLAVIIMSDDPASHIYVRNKHQACEAVGIQSFAFHLSTDTTWLKLKSLIETLNTRDDVDGILIQLPLPAHIPTELVLETIEPSKDVDGFHPFNMGKLAEGTPLLRPCTPYGIIQLLEYYQIGLKGKHAVIIGASNIVGRPMALELLNAKATVTVCHRSTVHLKDHVAAADLLIVAAGQQEVVDCQWLHKKQIIMDVGIHRLADGSLRGDVDFEKAETIVQAITPVPGGIGPMTIATLLNNTFMAYKAGIP